MADVIAVDVPCGACSACCHGQNIHLHPDLGDRPETYETEPMFNPVVGRMGTGLKHKPNGDCIYLQAGRCSIHERRPVICKTFSCVSLYRRMSLQERRDHVRAQPSAQAVFTAAKRLIEREQTAPGSAK